MTSNQITALSKDISNLKISEEEKEKKKKAFQKTLTMSYMYDHEPFDKLPSRYRVKRHFRPIPPKFVYGVGVSRDEFISLTLKVDPDHDITEDPSNTLQDYFENVCGQRPSFECVYSHDSMFVLGLANTYSKVNEDKVVAARDKIEAELIRIGWPRSKCMWYIAEANNIEREDWYSPNVEYSECDEARAYLSLLSTK